MNSKSAPIAVAVSEEEIIREIDTRLVQRGDVLKVMPGARIPTDGHILSGSTFVDESMITGESRPVSRRVNDFLFGSSLNQGSVIYMRVSSIDVNSTVTQIAKLVERAQMSKAPIQSYADQVARIFTPSILLISLGVFVTWTSLAYEHKIPTSWFKVIDQFQIDSLIPFY